MNYRIFLSSLLATFLGVVQAYSTIVIDASDSSPVPGASIFDASGKMIGMTDTDGSIPPTVCDKYPIAIRSLGYNEHTLTAPADTVLLTGRIYDLKEVEVGTADRNVVRLICYIREYSSSASSDKSATIFAEYMADYFLPRKGAKKIKTQRHPRVLGGRGFGHFTDSDSGLDSVAYLQHLGTGMFSWIELIEIDGKPVETSHRLKDNPALKGDTIHGKHGLKEVYRQNDRSFSATFDALADKKGHVWSPTALKLIGATLDIDQMFMSQTYFRNRSGEYWPEDLVSATYTMNALGRGKWIKKAFDTKGDVSLKAYFEIYIVDREYLPADEAKQLMKDGTLSMKVRRPAEAPQPDAATQRIIDRVIAERRDTGQGN